MATTNGFARDLLLTAQQVFKGSAPDTKITAPEFLRLCLDASQAQIISANKTPVSGHVKDIKLKFRPRSTPGNSSASFSCDADTARTYSEATIAQSLFRQIAVHFSFDTIAKFEEEASQLRSMPNVPARLGGIMNEVYNTLSSEMNGLLGSIDIDLLTKMGTSWGVNASTGLNTATTVNFNDDGTVNSFAEGMTKLLYDVSYNEMNTANVGIVGNGHIASYYLQKGALGANQSGLNAGALGYPSFYNDFYSVSAWGANKFGIIDKQSLQFLDLNSNQGFKVFDYGTSVYFMMPFPITTSNGNVVTMNFDVQVKFIDCPTEIDDRYGNPQTLQPGMIVFVRKPFDIFLPPSTSYAADDRLSGNNGTLLYTATNT